MLVARRATLAVLVLLSACSPTLIPNTKLEDTQDNRAILELVKAYKAAYEAKDAEGVAKLASERYLDARESISYATLRDELKKDFARVNQLQLELNVRRITVTGDRAEVDYFYSTSFQLAGSDPAWKTESDEKRMQLVREKNEWKVISGL